MQSVGFIILGVLLSLMLLCVLGLCYTMYLMIRNKRVGEFRYRLISACSAYHKDIALNNRDISVQLAEKIAYKTLHKYSHEKMLHSFKALKLESWFSDEECELMRKYGFRDLE